MWEKIELNDLQKERVSVLRERMLRAEHSKYRVFCDGGMSVLDRETEKEPLVVRKALALKKILTEMPIFIDQGEILVGARTIFSPPIYSSRKTKGGIDTGFGSTFVPDEHTLQGTRPGLEFYPHYATESERKTALKYGFDEGFVTNHCVAGYEKVLRLGFEGIKKEAEEAIERFKGEDNQEVSFLMAVIICVEAAEKLVERYHKLAQSMSKVESNQKRARELEEIAHVCSSINSGPPKTFHEALQLFLFTHLIIMVENYNLMAIGRFDQFMYPFLEKDLITGKITLTEALELLECLFIKLNDTADIHTDNGLNILLGGINREGKDSTNDLTYLCFLAKKEIHLVDPQLSLRYHSKSPKELLDFVWSLGFENSEPPRLYNDDIIITALEKVGVKSEDARDYAVDACQDIMIPGKSDFYPVFAGIYGTFFLNVLNESVKSLPRTSDFEEFLNLYKSNLKKAIDLHVQIANEKDAIIPKISPVPFLSSTIEGCVNSGKDKTEGGAIYNFTGFIGGGFVNLINSLAAVKKLVFEKKEIDSNELINALDSNFIGYEQLRLKLINRAPKWGNDDDYVDLIGKDISEFFSLEVHKHKNPRGGCFVSGLFTHHQVRLGKIIPATPDGRKQGEALALSLAPSLGTSKEGSTAIIKSVSKLDHTLFPLGTSLDMTFTASAESDLEKLLFLTQTFMFLGGCEFQANILDAKTLRDAQRNPEEYKDLIVRVWGFNAYFVTLTPDYQEEIIKRAESGF